MDTEAMLKMMEEKATAVGSVVRHIGSMEDAVNYTVDLCTEKSMKSIVCAGIQESDTQMLKDACAKKDIAFFQPPFRDKASDLELALTFADAGIADTGTIMVRSDSEDLRIATMASKIHVAILPQDTIIEDTAALEPELDADLKSDSPSYTAFITGPSRTADIERVLAIGVHGPLELHLLILKEKA